MKSEDAEDQLFKKHSDLCNKLNLNPKTISESWDSFQELNKNFTLEGDPFHWLGCAIFVICRNSNTPTIDESTIEGNCVNLTSLLRYCNLSLAQFFCNIRKWSEMTNASDTFRKKNEYLEEAFAVTCNVFKEYCSIFPKIFKAPEPMDMETSSGGSSRHHRSRKQRAVQCTPSKVFEFVWNLFITVRGEDSTYSNDLVHSYHLLLAICDLAFKNAFLSEKKELINPQFAGLPPEWLTPTFKVPDDAPCIIDLISNTEATVDAKYIKRYQCKNSLIVLFQNGTLEGNETNLTGLFNGQIFDNNFKNLQKAYDMQLLKKGGFDERIFLAEYKRRLLIERDLDSQKIAVNHFTSDIEENANSPDKEHTFGMVNPKGFDTPLTGRRFLNPRDRQGVNSLAIATQAIARLQIMLSGRKPEPSDELYEILKSCANNPVQKISEIVTQLGDTFIDSFVSKNSPNSDEQKEYAKNRLMFGTTLFYKLIENILIHEKTINKDISALTEKNIFYECIFACAMEMILHAYNIPRKFPWILEIYQIEAFDFIKVIELIVRSKDAFHRETIKHLNKIEETILEHLAWKSDSSLWVAIKKCEQDIPKEEEVALPNFSQNDNTSTNQTIENDTKAISNSSAVLQSPCPSATEHFQSPVQPGTSVNRNLFPKSNHLMLLVVNDKDGNKKLIPVVDSDNNVKDESQEKNLVEPSLSLPKPKRTGSLAIFFRKFYNLAAVRLEHLCIHMNIIDNELKRMMWTVFEYSITKSAKKLLKDRHLDQLLMCAVYVIHKVLKKPQIFTEIMKCYRQQPQAESHIYRNVLLKSQHVVVQDGMVVEVPEKRGDLIEFYNSVYIFEIRNFAMKFANPGTTGLDDILVSPLPQNCNKRKIISSRLQISKNVFVKPLDSPPLQLVGAKSYNYFFSRSPSKDLKDINKAINSNGINGKRLLVDEESEVSSKRAPNRKVQSLIEERRNNSNQQI